jgi:hypothetical protein
MPADGRAYKTMARPAYSEELARQTDEQIIKEIRAAERAIAASPHHPGPRTAYTLLPQPATMGGAEPLHLMVTVRRLQILKNRFVVSYTVRESGQLVYLDDLDLPFKYRLPKFQP